MSREKTPDHKPIWGFYNLQFVKSVKDIVQMYSLLRYLLNRILNHSKIPVYCS